MSFSDNEVSPVDSDGSFGGLTESSATFWAGCCCCFDGETEGPVSEDGPCCAEGVGAIIGFAIGVGHSSPTSGFITRGWTGV